MSQTRLIRSVLEERRKEFEPRFLEVLKVKTKGDKFSYLIRVLDDLFAVLPFAKYEKDSELGVRGMKLRVFNGQFYESVFTKDIYHELRAWLLDMRMESNLVVFMSDMIEKEVRYFIGRKVLEPRGSLMCFKNGVVDFSERLIRLKPFSPEFDVVKQYDFDFNPYAIKECSRWRAFLGERAFIRSDVFPILPEAVKQRMLQMFLGALLIDRRNISFEHFMILQGGGSNGKSVIFKVITALFGQEEVGSLQISHFSAQGDERLRAAASLEGKRLVYSPDEGSGSLRDVSLLKSITSGESVAIRKLGHDISEMESSPIVMMNTNKDWKLKDFTYRDRADDTSILRRVVILAFERSVPKEMRDTELLYKLLDERAGIFAWIVKGFLELRLNGYRMPDDVDMNREMRLGNAIGDVLIDGVSVSSSIITYLKLKQVKRFDSEYTQLNVKAHDLFHNYCKFCAMHDIPPVARVKFGRDMSTMGFPRTGDKREITYQLYWGGGKTCESFSKSVPDIQDDGSLFTGEQFSEEDFFEYFKD